MKVSKYENSIFPHSLHSTINLPAWRPKYKNVTLLSFLRQLTETITSKRYSFFKNFITNIVKIDEIREVLSTSYFVT